MNFYLSGLSIVFYFISVAECTFQFDSGSEALAVGSTIKIFLSNSVPDDVTDLRFFYFDQDGKKITNTSNLPIRPIPDVKVIDHKSEFIVIESLAVGQIIINVEDKINGSWVISKSSCKIAIMKYKALDILQKIIGWLYFFCWIISFYPQIFINFKRKSVIGLSFDFLVLNLFGFICYSVFNLTFYLSADIQEQYFKLHHSSVIPVQINDIVFSLHAVVLVIVTLIQCCIYERGEQKVSYPAWIILAACFLLLTIVTVLTTQNILTYLSLLYYISYVKLLISILKLIPQAYLNFKRKSTVGWSIENILLDISGGTLSIVQMIILSINYNDWIVYIGNPTKFFLGVLCILFDVIFIAQHYCLYPNKTDPNVTVDDEQSLLEDYFPEATE